MKLVFAKVGSSYQQIGGICPDGWIAMQGERPSPDHTAHADGSWVLTAVIPQSVTMRQARLALLAAGLLDDVEAALASMAGDEGKAARIEWDYSSEVHRHKPFVLSLGAQLGLTGEQLDQLFIAASQID